MENTLKNKHIRRISMVGSAAITALVLAACGGGGSTSLQSVPAVVTPKPSSTASVNPSASATINPNVSPSAIPKSTSTPMVNVSPVVSGTNAPIDITQNGVVEQVGIGWGSPTFNYGNATWSRNAIGPVSAECSKPIADNEIGLDTLAAGSFVDGNFKLLNTADALWVMQEYHVKKTTTTNQMSKSKMVSTQANEGSLLPPPDAWVKFDAYSGYYQINNGGSSAGSSRQCFNFFSRHDGQPYDSQTGISANIMGGYNPPRNLDYSDDVKGRILEFEMHNVHGASGSGSFLLDNGLRGSVVINSLGSIEIGSYAKGLNLKF